MRKNVYIIIPVYNGEKNLRKCLDSVFCQTYKNIQVICVNDGSIDKTKDILQDYATKFSNLIIINQKNGGVSKARNQALETLNYDEDAYITFIDSDDWIDDSFIETLVHMLEDTGTDIVCSSFYTVFNEKRSVLFKNIDKEIVTNNVEATRLLLRDETIQSHSPTKLYKLSLWRNVRYDSNLFYMEDQAVIFQTFVIAKSIFISNYSGYYYVQHEDRKKENTRLPNTKVVSGLEGYFYPCTYPFDDNILTEAAQYGLAGAYLMLMPHFNKKTASESERSSIKRIKSYIKNNKVIKKYKPSSKNNIIKRSICLFFGPLYPLVFRWIKKI